VTRKRGANVLGCPVRRTARAKAVGARWDEVKKAWYVAGSRSQKKIAKWKPKRSTDADAESTGGIRRSAAQSS
jgi:hypothetical protein